MSDRIGIFICWCGANIASTVEIEKALEKSKGLKSVVFAQDYMYMCSDPGQQLVRDSIVKESLNGIIVASCSPRMHEATFRKAAETVGLNPYLVEIANIREQCSWVHQNEKDKATEKAVNIIEAAVEKVRSNIALVPIEVSLNKRTLIIGGGIAGITAAADLTDAGYEVVLVEKEPALGGQVLKLGKTFPFLQDPKVYLREKADALLQHNAAAVYLESEIEDVEGYVGNFTVRIKQNAPDSDTAEGIVEEQVGAVILATGYRLYKNDNFPEYGGGKLGNVIDALSFERMLDENGPTRGRVINPVTGKEARSVLWVQCAGSRDPEFHKPYCSRVCCLYTVKQARLYKEKYPGASAFISYMDIRTDSKHCEEFYHESQEKQRIIYIRGRVSKVYRHGDVLISSVVDTLSQLALDIETDLVVLSNAMVPTEGIAGLAKQVRATIDTNGFLSETHIKLYPVESSTKGVYLAGCAQSPKDITDTVSQALAASGKIMTMYARDTLLQDPLTAEVDPLVCSGCGICVEACPYGARSINEYTLIAEVNRALCEGCGACVSACPNKACELINQTSIQNLNIIDVFQKEERKAQ